MEFILRRFELYGQLLNEYLEVDNQKKKEEIKVKLEAIRAGFLPIKFKGENYD